MKAERLRKPQWPGPVVMHQLQTGEPSLQLLLNLIEAGRLPPAQADRVTMLQ